MKWLHLSDIHYNPQNDGRSSHELRKKLPEYIKDEHITADHMFVTGDFRHAKFQAEDDGSTAREAAEFIVEIAEAAKIDTSNIHIVPGNHDLKRSENKKRICGIMKDYDPRDGRFRGKGDLSFLIERFGFYKQFVQELTKYGYVSPWSETLLPLHAKRCFPDFNLVYLNTSIICNSNEDRGNLVIGNYDLYRTLEEIKKENPDKPIIVLAHHGIDNFRVDEKRAIEQIFREYPVMLYLCGDAHDPCKGTTNDVLEVTMGCLTYSSGVRTVFSLGELKDKKCSIEAHKWDVDENEWGEYTQFNKKLRTWRLRPDIDKKSSVKVITKNHPVSPTSCFTGREAIMSKIEDMIYKFKIVLLHGMGGIGKSEICRKLFENYSNGHCTKEIEKIGWITYQNSLKESFFNQFPEIKSDDIEEYWSMAKYHIKSQADGLLLILDDANTLEQEELSELSKLGCMVIITSRKKMDRVEMVETDSLSIEECRGLYRVHSHDTISPDDTIDKIVSLAARHTLSVELLAKTQYAAGLEAEELLQELIKSGFDLKEIEESIPYQYSPEQSYNDQTEKRFIEHMSKIFDISEIRENSDELCIMQQLSLLASGVQIEIKLVKKWLDLKNLNSLNSLVRKGWIERCGNQSVSIHPVISDVVQYAAVPSPELADELAGRLADDIKIGTSGIFIEKLDRLVHAETFIKYVTFNTVNVACLLHNTADIYCEQSAYDRALEWFQRALEIKEKILGSEHPDTAISYNNIGRAYSKHGAYDKALEWYLKALKIREKVLGTEHPDAAASYNNIGFIYDSQGAYDRALEWYLKALEINEKVLGPEHPSTATSYNNIGFFYSRQGAYDKALEWFQKTSQSKN